MLNITLGKNNIYNRLEVLYFDDLEKHTYILGKSGSGKSTFLQNIFMSLVNADEGVCLIDPHGDLAAEILKFIPRSKINKVIYIDLNDQNFSLGFNPLKTNEYFDIDLIASILTKTFYHIYHASWGVQTDYILKNAFQALAAYGGTILMLSKFLTNSEFQNKVLKQVKNPVISHFWEIEYPILRRERPESILPIQNKIGQLLISKQMQNIFSSRNSRFCFRKALDKKQIIIVNLAKGLVGAENADLLGSIFVSYISQAAMTRANIPENERQKFTLLIDEFQTFSTESFTSILSEVRKYGLQLVLAHQYLDQLTPAVKSAVFGNTGTKILYNLGGKDALTLEPELFGWTSKVLTNLGKYEAVYITPTSLDLKLVQMQKPDFKIYNLSVKIKNESRRKYYNEAKKMNEKVNKFYENLRKPKGFKNTNKYPRR